MENCGGGLDHLTLRGDSRHLHHTFAQIALKRHKPACALEGILRRAQNFFVQRGLGPCLVHHPAIA